MGSLVRMKRNIYGAVQHAPPSEKDILRNYRAYEPRFRGSVRVYRHHSNSFVEHLLYSNWHLPLCWIWAGKRDTRASLPSLTSMIISVYVSLGIFHLAAHCTASYISLHFYHWARSRVRILIVLCSITPYLDLVQLCGAFILFSFYFVSFRESPLSRLAS